jgi:hypothetical protein
LILSVKVFDAQVDSNDVFFLLYGRSESIRTDVQVVKYSLNHYSQEFSPVLTALECVCKCPVSLAVVSAHAYMHQTVIILLLPNWG